MNNTANHQYQLPESLGPEHAGALYSTLLTALASDPIRRMEAEALLRGFEVVPHYCDVLAQIIAR